MGISHVYQVNHDLMPKYVTSIVGVVWLMDFLCDWLFFVCLSALFPCDVPKMRFFCVLNSFAYTSEVVDSNKFDNIMMRTARASMNTAP